MLILLSRKEKINEKKSNWKIGSKKNEYLANFVIYLVV